MKIFKVTLGVFLCVLFTKQLSADPLPVSELKRFLAKTKTMKADFKQVSFDEFGNPMQTSHGVFYLQRPGKFRWDYQNPFKQQIVSNSEMVWFYDEDLEQVTQKSMDQSLGSTPALLLSGDISLEDNFTMEKQGVDEDLQWVKLIPKNSQSGFNYILIGMANDSLGGMELSDNFGQLTRIYFSKVNTNIKIDAAMFEFKAPEGVDVFAD